MVENQVIEIILAAVILSMLIANAQVLYVRVDGLEVFVYVADVAAVDARTVQLTALIAREIQRLVVIPFVGSSYIEPSLRYALFGPELLQFDFLCQVCILHAD